MRKATLLLGLLALMVLPGCFSLNWAHNRRHVEKVFSQLEALHEDIDRVLFGLERNPAE